MNISFRNNKRSYFYTPISKKQICTLKDTHITYRCYDKSGYIKKTVNVSDKYSLSYNVVFFILDFISAPGRCLSAQEPSGRYKRPRADVAFEIKKKCHVMVFIFLTYRKCVACNENWYQVIDKFSFSLKHSDESIAYNKFILL